MVEETEEIEESSEGNDILAIIRAAITRRTENLVHFATVQK